jgi:YVTN family beta-propeller protein
MLLSVAGSLQLTSGARAPAAAGAPSTSAPAHASASTAAFSSVVPTSRVQPPATSVAEGASPNSTITFSESGLPNGTAWSVTLNGTTGVGIVGSIPLPSNPKGLFYDTLNGQLYVAVSGANELAVFNASSYALVGTIPMGSDPRYIALDPTTGDLFVTNTESNNVTVVDSSTDTVVGSIAVGANPIGIAYDPVNDQLYVADSEYYTNLSTPSNVTVIDAATATTVGSITVGYDARSLSIDPLNGWLYVANYGSGNLTVVNTTSSTVIASFLLLGGGVAPSAPTVDLANGELYVSDNYWGGQVLAVDPSNGTVQATIPVGAYPAGPFYDSLNGYVYVGNEFSDNVSVIATANNTVIGSIPTGVYPATIALDTATGDVFVATWDSNNISVVNDNAANGGAGWTVGPTTLTNTTANGAGSIQFLETNGTYSFDVSTLFASTPSPQVGSVVVRGANASVSVAFILGYGVTFNADGLPGGTNWSVTLSSIVSDGVVGSIPLPSNPKGLFYDTLNGQLYVAVSGANELAVFNASSCALIGTIPMGSDPRYIALDPTTGDLFVTNTHSNNVTIVDSSTDTVVGSIAVGANPIGIAYDPVNDQLYVADSEYYTNLSIPSNVTVIDAATATTVGSITVGYDSRSLVYDPLNAMLYVANYGSGNLTVVNTSTDTVAGSVVLGVGVAPSAPTVDTANGELYVSNNNWGGQIFAIDPTNNTVLAWVAVGAYPAGPFYDPLNGYVYVGNEFSGNVSVIATANNTVIGSIPTGVYPATIALDTATGDLFIATWDSNNITVLNGSAPEGGAAILGSPTTLENTTFGPMGTVQFFEPGGSYYFVADPVANYSVSPSSGWITVGVGGVTTWLFYNPIPSAVVTFTDHGSLPAGQRWSVTLGGSTESTTSATLSFTKPSGTYRYLVSGPNGRRVVGIPESGIAVLNGTGAVASLSFTKGASYRVTFDERGLPKGTNWCVSFGAEVCSSGTSVAFTGLPPGSYPYSVPARAGQTVTAALGKSALPLSGRLTVSTRGLTVTLTFVHPYAVTFVESGLPNGSSWSVKVGSDRISSATDSIVFELANGSHGFQIGAISGYAHASNPHVAKVVGGPVTVYVTFRVTHSHPPDTVDAVVATVVDAAPRGASSA